MKKFIYSMLVLAAVALGFSSCENVPMPYGYPSGATDPTNPDLPATGEGTFESPYNVAAANAVIAGGDFDGAKNFYVKGIITSIEGELPNTFGNATYYISDKADASNKLEVYRGYGFDGAKITSADDIKVGDEVIVMGQLVNYSGTYEITQGSKIVYLNGKSTGGGSTTTPEGEGTQASPYNVAAALQVVNALDANAQTETEIYVKGKISSIKNVDTGTFGNANYYISDDGSEKGQIYIFQSLFLGKAKFTAADQIKVGDEVVVCGKFTNFKGNTPETVGKGSSYLVSLNGKTESGGTTPSTGEAKGDGTKANPYNAVAAKNFASKLEQGATSENDVYIKGKISSIKYNFSAQYGTATFNISDDGKAENEFIIYSALYLNNAKYTEGDLLNVGDEVVICGKVTNYNGTLETASQKSYLFSWTKNGGGTTPAGDAVTIAATDFSLTDAQEVGEQTVKDIKFAFDKGTHASLAPKYYKAGGGTIRMYPGNKFTINAGSKKIAKITMACDSYNGVNYTAEEKVTSSLGTVALEGLTYTISGVNAAEVTITDGAEGTGQSKQLRMKTMTITFAK